MFFVTLGDGIAESVKVSLSVFGMTVGIMSCLMLIVYPVFCAANDEKYCILFEMNEKGVKIHTDEQTV